MHSCTVYESVQSVPAAVWGGLVAAGDFAMDRRLIELQERTLRAQSRMWVVVVNDGANETAAIACVARFDLEMMELKGWMKGGVGVVRKGWGRFLKNRVMFVGLPLPCASSHLRFAAGADRQGALEALDEQVRQLAKKDGAGFVVYKEFEDAAGADMGLLEKRGYVRGTLPVQHKLAGGYRHFKEYLAALKARYRNQITRSQKKFAAAGLRGVHMTDPEEIRQRFTPAVHALYGAVYARSKTKLEFLPLEFFCEVAEALPGQAGITFVEEFNENGASRVVGFTLEMRSNGVHYNVYSGVDYALNEDAHIYYNLFYHDMDYAFSSGAKMLHLGETSDDFKSRLGTEMVPMHCYVRPRNPMVRMIVRRFKEKLFPKQRVERQDVFKNGGKESAAEREGVSETAA